MNTFGVILYFKLKIHPLCSLLAHLSLSLAPPSLSASPLLLPLLVNNLSALIKQYKCLERRKRSSRIGSTKVSKPLLVFPLALKPAHVTGLSLNVFSCNSSESNKGPHDLISLVYEIFTNILKYQTDIIKFITNGSYILYRMQKD